MLSFLSHQFRQFNFFESWIFRDGLRKLVLCCSNHKNIKSVLLLVIIIQGIFYIQIVLHCSSESLVQFFSTVAANIIWKCFHKLAYQTSWLIPHLFVMSIVNSSVFLCSIEEISSTLCLLTSEIAFRLCCLWWEMTRTMMPGPKWSRRTLWDTVMGWRTKCMLWMD